MRALDLDRLRTREDADAALDRLARELAAAHPDLGADVVLQTVRESYTALARSATVSARPRSDCFSVSRSFEL